jgi:hypothetical protein
MYIELEEEGTGLRKWEHPRNVNTMKTNVVSGCPLILLLVLNHIVIPPTQFKNIPTLND